MKEVKAKRYAGPFTDIPFDNFIQSPIGLVPKDGGKDCRLIFHLSHPRDGTRTSVNSNTPPELCKVKYPDFMEAVQLCIQAGVGCNLSCSDMRAAFRNLGIKPEHWCPLVMKARSPFDGKFYYFVDKCLPFGASISCSHFQRFSNAIAHVMRVKYGKKNVNYLDDFLFVALLKLLCNNQVRLFLKICETINFPISLEKTFWSCTKLTFLGMLIDSVNQLVCIPEEKITKAVTLISDV